MKKPLLSVGRIQGYVAVFFTLCIVLILAGPAGQLRAQTGLSADAAVAKVADLGTIDTVPAILGRDGGYSALFENRSFWIYGDTILSRNGASTPDLLSNSCSWTADRDAADGIAGFTPFGESQGIPLELFPFTAEESAYNRDHLAEDCRSEPCGARWALWPGAAIGDNARQRLLLFFEKVLVLPGFLNFRTAGHSLAVWRNLDKPAERIPYDGVNDRPGLMFGETEPGFGSAALVVESMLYVFGCSLDGNLKPCRLARVLLAEAADRRAWEFYSASQGWQKETGESTVILDGNDMMSVSYNAYLNRYLAVYSRPMSTGVMMRTAEKVEGPWSEPLRAFDARAPANDVGWIYDAMEHPEYARESGRVIYITYSRQTGPLTFEMRLVAVTFR